MNDKERYEVNFKLATFMGIENTINENGKLILYDDFVSWYSKEYNPCGDIEQAHDVLDKVKNGPHMFYSCRQMLFKEFVHVELCFIVDPENWKTYESDKCETASLAICQAIVKYLEAIK